MCSTLVCGTIGSKVGWVEGSLRSYFGFQLRVQLNMLPIDFFILKKRKRENSTNEFPRPFQLNFTTLLWLAQNSYR